jgi:hypothetical protein
MKWFSNLFGFGKAELDEALTEAHKELTLLAGKFAAEEAVVAADVRAAGTAALATVKADAPEVEAVAKEAAQAVVAAVEAALVTHGL